MVSGIGPRGTLESLGIPVLKDLPGVGQNLWDQVWYGTSFRVKVPTNSASLNDPALAAAAVQAYIQNASGPLSVAGSGILGFEKLPATIRSSLSAATQKTLKGSFPNDWPDLEFLPVSGVIGNQSNYVIQDPRDGYNYGTIATSLVAPLSRGNISISTSSMSDPPLINPNWLTHPADVEVAVAALKRQRQAWNRLSNLTIGQERIPGPSVQSDEEIIRFIRGSLGPIWHAAATCKMGKTDDDMAVIDTKTRVYGVKGLRVVDASSFPFLPPGHPQATVYALAEKIADEILQKI